MSGADIVGHLMEWLLAGPLPAEPDHLDEEPSDYVQPNQFQAAGRD